MLLQVYIIFSARTLGLIEEKDPDWRTENITFNEIAFWGM